MKESIIAQKTFSFSLEIIRLYKRMIAENEYIISKQLLRSATSIGSNMEEALAGQSHKDFTAKMSIASKEARETRYRLRLLNESNMISFPVVSYLEEIKEIINILIKIVKTSQERIKK